MLAICSPASSASARALLLGGDAKAAEFQPGRALADPEIEPAVGDDVEGSQPFRLTGGVFVIVDHLADSVADPDVLGQRRAGR